MEIHLRENPKAPGRGLLVQFTYSKAAVDYIKLVPGLNWDPKLRAWASLGSEILLDLERLNIRPTWVSPEARVIVEDFRRQIWQVLEARREPITDELYGYQRQGSKFLTLNERAILADQPGLGKSKQSIDAHVGMGAKDVLVLAYKTLTYNWLQEYQTWYPDMNFGVVPDSTRERREFWRNKPDIVIANYEKLNAADWPMDNHWDVVTADEGTKFKNSATKVWKNVRDEVRRSQSTWVLTGTPLEKRLDDLYNLFALLRPAVLGNYMRYRSQHQVLGWGGEVIQINNLDLLRDRIGYWMLRRTKAQVLKNLPPKLPPENRFVRMSVPEQKEYQELLSEFGEFLDNAQLSIFNPLTKLLRMRQYCCTPAIWGVERKGSKYAELVDIIKDWDGQIIVFCSFTEVTRLLRNWLASDVDYNPEAYIDGDVPAKQRVDVVNLFNEGKVGKVLISSDAGRFGLNITSADLVIHYDQIFNPQLMEQREDRAHRIGQTLPVNVINLMYMDSVDYGIHLMNMEEAQLFEDVVEGAEEAMIRKLTPARLRKIAEGRI